MKNKNGKSVAVNLYLDQKDAEILDHIAKKLRANRSQAARMVISFYEKQTAHLPEADKIAVLVR